MSSIYLSPSTQENNKGVGNYGTEEYRMNQLCDIVQKYLRYGNGNFTIFRNRPDMTLTRVVADSNSKKTDIHVAIHSNASGVGGKGTEIFCSGSTKGTKLATLIYNKVAPLTINADRGIKVNTNYSEIGRVVAISCILEVMFHDNNTDVNDYYGKTELIGEGIAKAIYEYFNVPYNPTLALYRVMCGSYNNRDNALKRVEELKKAGFEAVITIT